MNKRILFLLFAFFMVGEAFAGQAYVDPLDGAVKSLPSNGKFESVSTGIARVDKTTDAVLTAAECKGTMVTNQAASAEVDLTMYPLTQSARTLFVEEEAQVIEINPPTGEALILNGVTLDVDDCVDSPGAGTGAMIIAIRRKTTAGAWIWDLTTSRGIWLDTGAAD